MNPIIDKYPKDYKHYIVPKMGLFSVEKDPGRYLGIKGWEQEIKQYLIIGEDSHTFVYRLQPSEEGHWVGNKVITSRFILPIGVHKSRLVKWTSGQLSLF